MEALITCDLGGTFLRLAVVLPNGTLQAATSLPTARMLSRTPSDTWDNIIRAICNYSCHVCNDVAKDAAIVVAVPGPVGERYRILSAPGIVGSATTPPDVYNRLRTQTNRPVYLLNDLSMAAWYYGCRLEVERALIVSVASGIGSKLVDRARPRMVIDDTAYAGEIGHVVVDFSEQAPNCECGGRGHLHAIASGRGIERAARERANLQPQEFAGSACARMFGGGANDLTNERHIVPAVQLSDAWATSVVQNCTSFLARAITIIAVAAGVERVIVIGGFALSLGPRYLAILREEVSKVSDYSLLGSSFVESIMLGDEKDACLRGAADFLASERRKLQ